MIIYKAIVLQKKKKFMLYIHDWRLNIYHFEFYGCVIYVINAPLYRIKISFKEDEIYIDVGDSSPHY